MPGVHQVANNIFTGYLTFFTTQNEFILADVPVFSERFPMEIQKNQEADFIKYARESSRSRGLSEEQAEANMRKEIREKSSYIENFFVVVLAPGLAIAVINVIWKLHYLYDGLNGRLHSPILGNPKNLKLPQTYYANKHMIKYEDEIKKYKNPKDQYRYNLIPLTQQETDYLMTLSLNESRLFIGFKNKESILRQVTIYNRLTKKELINLKINLQDIPNLINNFNYERDKG